MQSCCFAYLKTSDIFVTFAFIAVKGSFLNPDDDGDGDGDGSEGPYPTLEKKTKIVVVCFCRP